MPPRMSTSPKPLRTAMASEEHRRRWPSQQRAENRGYATASLQTACSCARIGYTPGMKTAVSLPDEVFRAAERHARRSKKSRSQLYSDALSEYLARHAPEEVTAAMNSVVEKLGTSRDAFVSSAALRILDHTEW